MKKKYLPIIIFIALFIIILFIGYLIYKKPMKEAAARNDFEENLISAYLNHDKPSIEELLEETGEYHFSDIDTYAYKGEVDCILQIDKINLKKLVIRGDYNDYNLDRYYFVTADTTTRLNYGNYVIYGHSSRTYGHSFNRLDEMEINDTFSLTQDNENYQYRIEAKDKVLRSEAGTLFPDGEYVTLVSCERTKPAGFPEKRVIIIRAVRNL